MKRILVLFILAAPLAGQETFVHTIPPGCTATMDESAITITCPPLQITTPIVLPMAHEGSQYQVDLSALANPTGGVPPYTYSLDPNPAPPPWLTLSPAGLTGGFVPFGTGTVNFSFTVMDSSQQLTKVVKGSIYAQNSSPHHSGR